MEFGAPHQFELDYVRPRPGRTLIVGSQIYEGREDRRKKFTDVVGLDMLAGPGVDEVWNLEEPAPHLGLFDHVECISVVEHSKKPWALAANLQALMVPGGTLHFSMPFIWRPHGYPNDYWRCTTEGVKLIFDKIEWSALMYGHEELSPKKKMRAFNTPDTGFPYFARTEVFGFGKKV